MERKEFKDAVSNGFDTYKDIIIKKIDGIKLTSFRSFHDKYMCLGDVITVVSGKNGTMKSTLLGLIAHPFSSPNGAKDVFGKDLKTRHSDVFYLSPEKDSDQYLYYLRITTVDGITFEEPIRVYKRLNPNGQYRHRLTVGKDNKEGRGNFSLNTSFINLNRLIPIVCTQAQIVKEEVEKKLQEFVAEGYMKILQKEAFSAPVQVLDKSFKQTFGPGKEADYDFKSISSGEDNIGHILNKMYAFLQYKTDNVGALQGIFCIDEIEASLHPVAQINLFDFIYNWAKKNHIQVVINTHSLYLIQHIIELQKKISNKDDIVLNMISTAFVSDKNYNIIKNPNYNEAHKELTLKYVDIGEIYKINIICEDEIAEYYLKRIISNQKALKRLEFMHNLNEDIVGNGFTGLKSLLKNGQKLLENTIIFFDPEVNVSDLSRCRSKFFVLPSLHGMPIEKEIVKYIYDLPGDHEFFKYFAKEKNAFLNVFSNFDIIHLHDIENIKQDNVKKYKKWSNLNKSAFKKYITFYARHNDTKIFLDDIIKCMNDIFIRKGLPMISVEK